MLRKLITSRRFKYWKGKAAASIFESLPTGGHVCVSSWMLGLLTHLTFLCMTLSEV